MQYKAPILALALVACDTPASPVIDPESIPIEFTVEVIRFNDDRTTTVHGGIGEIVVHGSIITGQAGYALRPDFARASGGGYALKILAEETSGGITIPIHYRYQASMRELPRGRYTLEVVHRIPAEDRAYTAFDGAVWVR